MKKKRVSDKFCDECEKIIALNETDSDMFASNQESPAGNDVVNSPTAYLNDTSDNTSIQESQIQEYLRSMIMEAL